MICLLCLSVLSCRCLYFCCHLHCEQWAFKRYFITIIPVKIRFHTHIHMSHQWKHGAYTHRKIWWVKHFRWKAERNRQKKQRRLGTKSVFIGELKNVMYETHSYNNTNTHPAKYWKLSTEWNKTFSQPTQFVRYERAEISFWFTNSISNDSNGNWSSSNFTNWNEISIRIVTKTKKIVLFFLLSLFWSKFDSYCIFGLRFEAFSRITSFLWRVCTGRILCILIQFEFTRVLFVCPNPRIFFVEISSIFLSTI